MNIFDNLKLTNYLIKISIVILLYVFFLYPLSISLLLKENHKIKLKHQPLNPICCGFNKIKLKFKTEKKTNFLKV